MSKRLSMTNRLSLAATLISAVLLTACATTPPNTQPPNIILIVANDLGYGDTSVYGSPTIRTPHIDALAAGGVRFTAGYVSHPVCSPSRAGLMTGRYQQRHGWEFNPAGRDTQIGMSASETTIADALKARGYATGMVGKWHLGYRGAHHPNQRGFDDYFGVLAGGSIYINPETPGVESAGIAPTPRARNDRVAVYRNQDKIEFSDYLTDVFTDESLAFIDRNGDQPFLLYLSHTAPHTPLQATRRYLDRYRHIEDKTARIYAAMVAALDDSVGAIVAR